MACWNRRHITRTFWYTNLDVHVHILLGIPIHTAQRSGASNFLCAHVHPRIQARLNVVALGKKACVADTSHLPAVREAFRYAFFP